MDGSLGSCKLHETVLPTLIGYDSRALPILEVKSPEGDERDFLQQFGVLTKVNGKLFLKKLKQTKAKVCSGNKEPLKCNSTNKLQAISTTPKRLQS